MRPDMSDKLIHWTSGADLTDACGNLLSIMRDRHVRGRVIMNTKHTKVITLLLLGLVIFSKSAISSQEWSIYGCRVLLPEDTPQHKVIKLFTSPELAQASGIDELKEGGCFNKDKPVKFVGYKPKRREPIQKLENEVTLQCLKENQLYRKGPNSSELENRPIHTDRERYFQVTGEYIVGRYVDLSDSSTTYTIHDIDDLVIKASGSFPWYLDHEALVKLITPPQQRACWMACTSKMEIVVNRRTLEVQTKSFDSDGKTISAASFSCKLSKKKI